MFQSAIKLTLIGLMFGAVGCGSEDDATTTNPITTGGVGGGAGVAGMSVTGGVGGTGGMPAVTAGTGGGASGAGGAGGMAGGAAGMNGGTGGTGGMTAGTGGAGGMTGGAGGMSGGTGGMTAGTAGMAPSAEVMMCIDNHFDGVNDTCKQCMCECDAPAASDCDETCWKLSLCTYVHCQMSNPVNQGLANQTDCVVNFCGDYLGSDLGNAATVLTATGCFGPSECGAACASWWAMDIASGPMMAQ
jgi:hypothetical protein